ncbi:MAG: serine hydrolase [Bacilli bacterium]
MAMQNIGAWVKEFFPQQGQAYSVPGATVAVVQDGEVLAMESWGYAELGRRIEVTSDTRFPIASLTKAFTAAHLSLLVEKGVLRWNDRIKEIIPEFALKESNLERQVTVFDAAVHMSGVGNHDHIWNFRTDSRDSIIQKLRYVEVGEYPKKFEYTNVMYAVLGRVIERLTKLSYEASLEEVVLRPLGMLDSAFPMDPCNDQDRVCAKPYRILDDHAVERGLFEAGAMNPALGMISTTRDLSSWMKALLADYDGNADILMSSHSVRNLFSKNSFADANLLPEEFRDTGYGIGWYSSTYRKACEVVFHGGNRFGYSSILMLLPQHRFGVAVLCNQDVSLFPAAVAYSILDQRLSLGGIDWSEKLPPHGLLHNQFIQFQTKLTFFEGQANPDAQPTHSLADFAGEYEHPAYGICRVELRDSQLVMSLEFQEPELPLKHQQFNSFIAFSNPVFTEEIAVFRVWFQLNWEGQVERVAVSCGRKQSMIEFPRRKGTHVLSSSAMETLCGTYEGAGLRVVVYKGARGLKAKFIGLSSNPDMVMIHKDGFVFSAMGDDGVELSFEVDEGERPTHLKLWNSEAFTLFTRLADDGAV